MYVRSHEGHAHSGEGVDRLAGVQNPPTAADASHAFARTRFIFQYLRHVVMTVRREAKV